MALAAFSSTRLSTICAKAQQRTEHDMSHVILRTRRHSRVAFYRWLECARAGEQLEYHRGLLTRDRSPASELADDDRRALAEIADAVFRAAEGGQVHLVQRRHWPFDFSYLAIKASCRARATPAASPPQLPAAA
jgi:hypothetical protein